MQNNTTVLHDTRHPQLYGPVFLCSGSQLVLHPTASRKIWCEYSLTSWVTRHALWAPLWLHDVLFLSWARKKIDIYSGRITKRRRKLSVCRLGLPVLPTFMRFWEWGKKPGVCLPSLGAVMRSMLPVADLWVRLLSIASALLVVVFSCSSWIMWVLASIAFFSLFVYSCILCSVCYLHSLLFCSRVIIERCEVFFSEKRLVFAFVIHIVFLWRCQLWNCLFEMLPVCLPVCVRFCMISMASIVRVLL